VDPRAAPSDGVSAMDTAARTTQIIAAVLNVEQATLERSSSPDTIAAWDSLRHVQLVLAIEEAFGIQFAVEDIEAMGTVGAVADAVRRLVPEA
jgi:acyl carrier protein